MNSADQYILCSNVLNERLCLITEVLGRFVSCAPRAMDIAKLKMQTGRSPRELLMLCDLLCREELLQPHPTRNHCWQLAREASHVTLEDAFRCAVKEQSIRGSTRRQKTARVFDASPHREVDMLVVQAMIGVNQSVFQHLRQFSLDRLKVLAAGM